MIAKLEDIDGQIADLIVRRRELAELVRTGERSIHGTRRRLHPEHESGTRRADLHREIAFADEPLGPDTLIPIAGRALRTLLHDLLVAAEVSLTRDDLERLVVAHGYEPPAPARRSIPNALRREIETGRVERVARGLYRAVQ